MSAPAIVHSAFLIKDHTSHLVNFKKQISRLYSKSTESELLGVVPGIFILNKVHSAVV